MTPEQAAEMISILQNIFTWMFFMGGALMWVGALGTWVFVVEWRRRSRTETKDDDWGKVVE